MAVARQTTHVRAGRAKKFDGGRACAANPNTCGLAGQRQVLQVAVWDAAATPHAALGAMALPLLLFSQAGDELGGWFELCDVAAGGHRYSLLDPTRWLRDDARVCVCRAAHTGPGLFVRRGDLVVVLELGAEWSLARCAQTEAVGAVPTALLQQ